jgi:nickel superoxide dismutase
MRKIGSNCGVILIILVTSLWINSALAHCEIPCGIYSDEMRFSLIAEHITTIEKSMKMIVDLSKEQQNNNNQLVRWITNKESHANHIQEIISQYFMTQRVKPVEESNGERYKKYVKQITLLHQMLVYAMKAKQTTDLNNVEKLRDLTEEFRILYLGD